MAEVDVLVCMKRPLTSTGVPVVVGGLLALPGVNDVRVDGRRQRMMLVRYDPDRVAARSFLDTVRGLGHEGRLVGV